MAAARNMVIAGDYQGKAVMLNFGYATIVTGFGKWINLSKMAVESYELITDEHHKSAASGIARGMVGGALFGTVGMIAGSMSAKEKGIYQVAIQFKNGKRSLLEVDDNLYKMIVKNCF